MPRVGRHPLKQKGVQEAPPEPPKITITTIVHIPMLEGYWTESLEVLKIFFQSLFESTSQPFDLMVFDNGSCEEVQNFLFELQSAGKIQYLILSRRNLRKLGALDYLLSSAPGEFIAYADSDVYFLPGWLDESLKILSVFPEAGKVTALPIVGGDTSQISSLVFGLAQKDPTITIETGILVPEMYVDAHRLSLGKTREAYAERLKNRKDTLLKRDGCEALLSGADFQFIITRKAARAVLPLKVENPEEYFDPIYSPVLEHRLENAGFWQLSTPGYWIHHMGNQIPDLENELSWMDSNLLASHVVQIPPQSQSERWIDNAFRNFRQRKMVRRFLMKIHLLTYRLLYD